MKKDKNMTITYFQDRTGQPSSSRRESTILQPITSKKIFLCKAESFLSWNLTSCAGLYHFTTQLIKLITSWHLWIPFLSSLHLQPDISKHLRKREGCFSECSRNEPILATTWWVDPYFVHVMHAFHWAWNSYISALCMSSWLIMTIRTVLIFLHFY